MDSQNESLGSQDLQCYEENYPRRSRSPLRRPTSKQGTRNQIKLNTQNCDQLKTEGQSASDTQKKVQCNMANKLKDVKINEDQKEAENSETKHSNKFEDRARKRLKINYGHNDFVEMMTPTEEPTQRLPKENMVLCPRPRFVIPIKNLVVKELKHLTDDIKSDLNINTKFFQIIRKIIRIRLAYVLRGKPRLKNKEIMVLYRECFPVETDDALVECIKQGVLGGLYDHVTDSDLDEDVETSGNVKESNSDEIESNGEERDSNGKQKESKEDQFVEEKSETSLSQSWIVNSEAVNIGAKEEKFTGYQTEAIEEKLETSETQSWIVNSATAYKDTEEKESKRNRTESIKEKSETSETQSWIISSDAVNIDAQDKESKNDQIQ